MEPGNRRAPDGMEDCFVDRRLKEDMVVEGQEQRGEIMIFETFKDMDLDRLNDRPFTLTATSEY